ncbi:MAG: phosphopantothenoylcysteine decarboxylase [Gemmataceae bacterium]
MHLLVTAGNSQMPIDRVRCITNIFTGRTGAGIAVYAHTRGHDVTLLTSHPEAVDQRLTADPPGRWTLKTYRTFDDFQALLEPLVRQGMMDAIIHCAAMSDFRTAGIYAPAPGTRLDEKQHWVSDTAAPPGLVDRSAEKVKSTEPELWLRLVRTPKLIDRFRCDWGFKGIVVKFKLEVGLDDNRLLEIAERSRLESAADLMVANTLEGAPHWAYLGPFPGGYLKVSRRDLAARLLQEVESLIGKKNHG